MAVRGKKAKATAKTGPKKPRKYTVNSEALAEICGVHPNTVALWIKAGMPVSGRAGTGGRSNTIDLGAAIQWRRQVDGHEFEERLAAVRSSPDMDKLRARKLEAEARIAEANAAAREGELVPADEVVDRWSRIVLSVREGVLSLAPRAVQAGVLAPEQEDALSDLSRDVLRDLAKGADA